MGNIYENQNFILNKKLYKKCKKKMLYKYKNEYEDELTEKDFYPPADDRVLQSLIEDIDEGNNYLEYAEYIYNLYEEENYYEN